MSVHVKRMADLLKSGAILLSEHCPVCNSPLFDISGKIYCVKCDRPVQIVKSAEEEGKVKADIFLADLEETFYLKMREAIAAVKSESEPDRVSKNLTLISQWLDLLERVKRLKQGA